MRLLIIILSLLLSTGCGGNTRERPQTTIAVSNWVGYTPLLYAYQKGWLEDLDIKVVSTTSLAASLEFAKRGLVDGFCATQMEYEAVKESFAPLIALDRSYGGDMILSNMTKEELYALHDTGVDVYLEYESINLLLWQYFKDSRKWNNITFDLKSNTQSFIAELKFREPSIIVTYYPYASRHIEKGLHVITTTKQSDLLIADMLFVRRQDIPEDPVRYKKLKAIIKRAIAALENNPVEYYRTVYKYLEGQSYEEFIGSLNDIKWMLDPEPSQKTLLDSRGVETGTLL